MSRQQITYDDPVALLRGLVDALIVQRATQLNPIRAAYHFGSSATSQGDISDTPGRDIDLLIVLDRATVSGENPFLIRAVQTHAENLRFLKTPVCVVFNGVIPPSLPRPICIVDLLWDSVEAIERCKATSVIQAKRPRRLLTGTDVYQPLVATEISFTLVHDYADTCRRYLQREYGGRTDTLATIAVAKSALFVASVLDNETVRSANKNFILSRLRQSKWKEVVAIEELANVIAGPENHSVTAAQALFEKVVSQVLAACERCG